MRSLLEFTHKRLLAGFLLVVWIATIYPVGSVLSVQPADHDKTSHSDAPPLKKGGTGGFTPLDTPSASQNKSPSVPLFQRGMTELPESTLPVELVARDASPTQPLCVALTNDSGVQRSLPITPGSALRLSFRHSIYGSQVEEVFALRRDGFQLTQLRYGEARLVDFYGHEHAQFENGVWIVTPTPTLLPSLNLHLSSDAVMSLRFDRSANAKQLVIQPGSALRVTVAACN